MKVVALTSILLMWCFSTVDSGQLLEYDIPGEQCTYISVSSDQYRVSTVIDASGHYPSSANCAIGFRTDVGKRFFLRLTSMDMEFSAECANDALLIYDGTSDQDLSLTSTSYGICGRSVSLPNYFYSTSNSVSIKFVTDASNSDGNGFEILITAFTEAATEAECTDGFKCLSSTKCMSQDIYCDTHFQCADGSDEPSGCTPSAANGDIRGNWFLLACIGVTMLSFHL